MAILILIAGQFGWLKPVGSFFTWATGPVFRASRGFAVGTTNFFVSLFTIGNLQRENAVLEERSTILEAENARLNASLSEYKTLEQALNLKERSGFSLLAGRVVSVDPTSLNQTLVIDRGASSGVVAGQAAVDAAGAYVGRVNRVLKNTSEITLISDGKSRLPVEVADTSARGIIAGQYALAVRLVEVPVGQELKLGARLITTGFTPGVPQGLLVGYIDSIENSGGNLFQQAQVRSAAQLRQLRVIFLIVGLQE